MPIHILGEQEKTPYAKGSVGWRIPQRLQTWYLVCSAKELKPGQVLSWGLPGRSVVLYRGLEDGKVHALSAHCSHMGTHLGQGKVIGNCLRCPLHYWEYGGDGACCKIPGADNIPRAAQQRVYPVVERYGSIFLFNGPEPLFEPPGFVGALEEELLMCHGEKVRLKCPWYAISANGFDIQHFQTVHERSLREGPELEQLDSYRIRLRYVSRVTGKSIGDRTMKWLSNDRIRIKIVCIGGTVVTVESHVGRTRNMLMLCIRPTENGVEVTPVFGVYRGNLPIMDTIRLQLARWLFSAFMRKDVTVMDDMRFHPSLVRPLDPVLCGFLQYLQHLPEDTGNDHAGEFD